MNFLLLDPAIVRAALLWAVPLCYLAAAIALGGRSRPDVVWRWALAGATVGVAAAVASLVWLALRGPIIVRAVDLGGVIGHEIHGLGVRADSVGTSVLLLVSFVGWVIVRYSRAYLGGDPGQPRYVRALMGTLAAVALVIITNNLIVLTLAWMASSLALHGLLTFYGDRQPALIAAHKKFLASRVADVCMICAVILIGQNLGTLDIDEVLRRAGALADYPASMELAVVLIVITALLKCAQLPVHGWLIQVMEAPTPVSALLHAGVVNLGGFVLIRLAPLVSDVPAAQMLLVLIGSVTAAVAALVMMTRISIKVMLAWSTCAQMGFMLMQCGLGMYELALLHLIAHSLYKAHAFLAAGGAVAQARLQRLSQAPAPLGVGAALLGALAGVTVVTGAALLWRIPEAELRALWGLAVVVCLALTPLLSARALRLGGIWPLAFVSGAFGVALAYFALHDVFSIWIDMPARNAPAAPVLVAVMLLCFVALFLVQTVIRARPSGAIARRMYPWFYAGLFLDELFTRITFRLWPARLSQKRNGVGAGSTTGAT